VAEWHGEAMEFLASPDGSRALILPWFKQSPILWDLTTGRCLPALSGLFQPVTCAAFSPDGSMLAFADSDGFKTFIRLRETTAGRELRQLGEGKQAFSVSALAFSPDGRTLAAGYTDGSLTLWDLITNRPRHRVTGPQKKWVWPVTFSSDSRLLAAVWEGEYVIHLYETMSGQEIRVLRGQSTPIHALAFAADNRTLASSGPVPDSADKECLPPFTKLEAAIHLWDVLTGKQIHRLPGHQGRVHTLAFSSDGNTLVSGGGVEMVLSWDVAAVTHRRPDSKELPSAKLTDLWSALAARDAARAQRAVAELIQSPDTALTFLEKMLLPVPPVKLASIVALIADLDHADFARRERASRELEKIGEPAGPALRKLLKEKPSLEVRKRIEILLEAIDGRPTSPEGLRTFRALQVLETIGTPKAKQILEGLASGAAEAALTQEAKAALTRLSRRNANR
ncbi:MAG TPA: WD40 repeat domain-containing protein, partial [Chloroflexota bacterium]